MDKHKKRAGTKKVFQHVNLSDPVRGTHTDTFHRAKGQRSSRMTCKILLLHSMFTLIYLLAPLVFTGNNAYIVIFVNLCCLTTDDVIKWYRSPKTL